MNYANLNIKRQLLTDLFKGKSDGLRTYQRQRQQQDSPLQWVIDARAIDGSITAIDKQGNQSLMSEQEFSQLPRPGPIWQIVDHSGGVKPPKIDEEY